MAAEMAEQPDRLAGLFDRSAEIARTVRAVAPEPWGTTVVVARGSSDHAATCGRYLLEMATRRPVSSASPSISTRYRVPMDFAGCLVVAASQSGRTPEIVETVQLARAHGGRTLAITNDGESPLAAAADATIALGVGIEQAVPATKTVTAQIAAFGLVAEAVRPVGFGPEVCARIPAEVAGLLADAEPAGAIADWLSTANRLVTVARGLLGGAAAETALKIQETTSLLAAFYSAADLRHGPIATASRALPVLAFAHPGPTAADVLGLVDDLRRRGADVRLAGPVDGSSLWWSTELPEAVAPITAVVRGQQVALALARALGRDPDHPSGLSKVTAT
jgi:glucosamine--fructose-6-phosphate aminotransferase (isomerizing)